MRMCICHTRHVHSSMWMRNIRHVHLSMCMRHMRHMHQSMRMIDRLGHVREQARSWNLELCASSAYLLTCLPAYLLTHVPT